MIPYPGLTNHWLETKFLRHPTRCLPAIGSSYRRPTSQRTSPPNKLFPVLSLPQRCVGYVNKLPGEQTAENSMGKNSPWRFKMAALCPEFWQNHNLKGQNNVTCLKACKCHSFSRRYPWIFWIGEGFMGVADLLEIMPEDGSTKPRYLRKNIFILKPKL